MHMFMSMCSRSGYRTGVRHWMEVLGSPIKLICSLLIQFGGFDANLKVKYDVMKEISAQN